MGLISCAWGEISVAFPSIIKFFWSQESDAHHESDLRRQEGEFESRLMSEAREAEAALEVARHGCQMAIAKFIDCIRLALRA